MYINKIILAIDASLNSCSVAILKYGKIYSNFKYCYQNHEKVILNLIKESLQKKSLNIQDIQLIVCTNGPGNFTGIRISMGVSQALSISNGIPLISFSTFQILSEQVWKRYSIKKVLIILKISKKYFFWSKYKKNKNNVWIGLKNEQLFYPHKEIKIFLKNLNGLWATIGDFWKKYYFNYENNINLFYTHIQCPRAIDLISYTLDYLKMYPNSIYNKINPNYLLSF